MRAVRRVPAPSERLRRGGRARSDPLPGDGGCHAMSYAVKEIYYTLQGEGANAGSPAVFLRFAGCNLWSGREEDRSSAVCRFCDTDFVGTDGPGGGRFASAPLLAEAGLKAWPRGGEEHRLVLWPRGGPPLPLRSPLLQAPH